MEVDKEGTNIEDEIGNFSYFQLTINGIPKSIQNLMKTKVRNFLKASYTLLK